jgi:hypothetical protein
MMYLQTFLLKGGTQEDARMYRATKNMPKVGFDIKPTELVG